MTAPASAPSAEDFFGGGLPSAAFPVVGTVVEGTITRIGQPQEAKKFKSQEIDRWPDGRPKYVLPIDLQTQLRDPQVPGDNGMRTLWVKGRIKDAIDGALKEHGYGTKPRVGGQLAVAFTHEEPSEDGGNAAKFYAARYTPPAVKAADGFFGAPPAPSAPAPAPAPAPGAWPAAPVAPATQPFAQAPAPPPAWPGIPGMVSPVPAAPPAPVQPQLPTGLPLEAWVDAAYAHLTDDQRAAIKAAGLDPTGQAGLTEAQIAGAFGPAQPTAGRMGA